ncbi:unnamed protein product [Penicillium camemberti]|uniref:Str. FM013 n=1 Tax=Penicillium camemberti (strain FM 013) TaxID=1429867 RepID=A0A0G4PB97_PENC3|nr:unnamed protein product [Penicillium camemberti]
MGFLPSPGDHITFEKPKPTEWTIVAKLSQEACQKHMLDVQDGAGPSYAVATFCVCSDLDGQQAYMRVYLQVPHEGTQWLPPNERAKQAAAGYHSEVEAMKAFYEQGSTITPTLLAISEDIQDKQGIIPGGYIIHCIFQRVPGLRLADDNIAPEYRPTPHKFFLAFSKPERDHIRMVFDKEYRELNKLGWVPIFPWAMSLIWDSDASKLYFVDFRTARKVGDREKKDAGGEKRRHIL